MAFNTNTAAAASNASDNNWKADAFLNLYADKADGSSLKVGAIAFKLGKKTDAALIKRLSEEGGVEALSKVLRLDFRMVTDEPISDIGF
jgi:hypothetical protein